MSPVHPVLAPTSCLPRLRNPAPGDITDGTIASALRTLTDIYCPLPRAAAFSKPSLPSSQADYLAVPASTISAPSSGISTPIPADSGYASGEEEEDEEGKQTEGDRALADADALAKLRNDEYERQFAIRWLTTFVARAEELLCDLDDDARQRLIDDASYILASFSSASDEADDDDDGAIVREFRFRVAGGGGSGDDDDTIEVRLTDGTPARGSDHTDVGLQSWGASIIGSELLCAEPERFGLSARALGDAPRIIELGAGTGLVGIAVAKLLPRLGVPRAEVVATDYHPAVLANLRDNIAANFPGTGDETAPPVVVRACLLDWSAPRLDDPPLDRPAQMLLATDVVYAPEHAVWLRDCAARLLAPGGVFWLIASVRPNGRFEGVLDTIEVAFADVDRCPRSDDGERVLRIVGKEMIDKKRGVGRADEVGYRMFKIGWERVEKATGDKTS